MAIVKDIKKKKKGTCGIEETLGEKNQGFTEDSKLQYLRNLTQCSSPVLPNHRKFSLYTCSKPFTAWVGLFDHDLNKLKRGKKSISVYLN